MADRNDAQREACERNWRILRLRGMIANAKTAMTGERRTLLITIVNEELAELGARRED